MNTHENAVNLYQSYIDDVVKGRIVTGKYIKKAVKRHLSDLEKSKTDSYQYTFDEARAVRAIKFIKKLKHTGGENANKPFDLQPWQAWIIAMTFGWVNKRTGFRRFKKVYLKVARKNGKTELAAAIALYGLLADKVGDRVEWNAEVYAIATKEKQARIVFNKSKSMLNKLRTDHMKIRALTGVHMYNLYVLQTESFMRPLVASADKLDGLGAHFLIVDEYHAFMTDDLIKVMETGMVHRKQGLVFITTTAGRYITRPCYHYEKSCKDTLDGIKTDETSFFAIYDMDDGDDWKDETNWAKANPNINVTVPVENLRISFEKAQYSKNEEIEFRVKNLNEWYQSGTSWIPDDEWTASGTGLVDDVELEGRPCYIGLDLSRKNDLTVKVNVFPPFADDKEVKVLCTFYCPKDNIEKRSKRDGVPYIQWDDDGLITATPGPTIDYSYLISDIQDDAKRYDVKRLEYDETFAWEVVPKLEDMGIKCFNYPQNCKNMDPPIQKIEELVARKLLNHGNHPILRWNVSNVVLFVDTSERKRFDKRKVQERIDGAVAMAMAIGGWITDDEPGESKYETQELYSI